MFFFTGSAQKVLSMELVPPNSKKRLSTLVPPNIPRMAKFHKGLQIIYFKDITQEKDSHNFLPSVSETKEL